MGMEAFLHQLLFHARSAGTIHVQSLLLRFIELLREDESQIRKKSVSDDQRNYSLEGLAFFVRLNCNLFGYR